MKKQFLLLITASFLAHHLMGDEPVKTFKTFVTIQSYKFKSLEKAVDDLTLEYTIADGPVTKLPNKELAWPVTPDTEHKINYTFEVPVENIKEGAFNFNVQLLRKRTKLLPCAFKIKHIGVFNRTYLCKTLNLKNDGEDDLVEVKVYTDIIRTHTEVPEEQLALKTAE